MHIKRFALATILIPSITYNMDNVMVNGDKDQSLKALQLKSIPTEDNVHTVVSTSARSDSQKKYTEQRNKKEDKKIEDPYRKPTRMSDID